MSPRSTQTAGAPNMNPNDTRNTRPERGSRAHTAWADSPPNRPGPNTERPLARFIFAESILAALLLVLVGLLVYVAGAL